MSARRSIAPKQTGDLIITSGVTPYASIAELVTASEGSLAAGYYSASVPSSHPDFPNVLTYWDGTDFLPRPLSIIEDWWNDVSVWVNQHGLFSAFNQGSGDQVTVGNVVRSWRHPLRNELGVAATTVEKTAELGGGLIFNEGLLTFDNAPSTQLSAGPFEVFSSVRARDLLDTNAGIAGTWTFGAQGWALILQNSAAPNAPVFGFNGAFASGLARIDTDPHIIHGRYDGAFNFISIDGVDVGSVAGVSSSDGQALVLGAYQADNGVTRCNAVIGEFLKINRIFSPEERAAVVAEMQTRANS